MTDKQPVTFIYTNSYDSTTDLLVKKLGADKIFRFNFDLWRHYKIEIRSNSFRIENPTGLYVDDSNIAKFYWRKAMQTQDLRPDANVPAEARYMEAELWYALREVVNRFRGKGKLVLVEPFGDLHAGKFTQMAIASQYFTVPEYKFLCGAPDALEKEQQRIVKSLSSKRIRKGESFYTTQVEESELDPSAPWMIQEFVDAEKDITIAFVRDRFFAFELDRSQFKNRTADWREVSLDDSTHEWPAHTLPDDLASSVVTFMSDMGLQYGRIDMLYYQGQYYFLEVNSNGEWGWLDFEGSHGLLEKIMAEVSPDTPVHAIPSNRIIKIP